MDNMDQDLFRSFCFYGGLLVAKMIAMPFLTARQRLSKGAFANEEDARANKGKVNTHEDVERVRRAHLNDMESIYLFFANAAFYLMTGPSSWLALNLMRAYTATRYLHTVCYLGQIPQPSRGLSWAVGTFIQVYMAYCTICHFW